MDAMTTQQKMELALEHFGSGRLRDTEGLCRQILSAQPQHAEALHLLGVLANQTGHRDAAVALIRRAIATSPQTAEYHSNLGVILATQGHLDEAAAACRDALALSPGLAEAHYNLGNALRAAGTLEPAAASYRQALALKADYPQAHNNLGNVLLATGNLDDAIEAYSQAIFLQPDYAHARSNLGNALRDTGRLDEALEAHRQAVASAPANPEIRSNMILSLYYPANADVQIILEESRRWNVVHAEPLRNLVRASGNDPSPERRLRVGFVLPDLRIHSVGCFLMPLLEARDRQNVHATCYATNAKVDATTDRMRAHSDNWCNVSDLSDDAAAERIRDDRIDILVDLSAHTAGNRLLVFARKPAPVQVTYLGFPGTTGLSAIDYRLTDAFVDPLDEDGFCAEALVRLPDSAWCYAPLSGSPDVATLPALENGYVTFGSFNSLAKITPHVLYLWARILQQVDASRLLLKSAAFRNVGPADRMRAFFADHGIEAERIRLLPDDGTHLGHLQRYAEVDIALDAFPYQGMATTCEALWMGLPVVSFAGQHHVSRVGLSLLSNAAMPELAATSYDGYVQVATQLAADLRMLSDLRAGLRQRMRNSVLMDAPRFAGNIETAFRDMWRTWCAQRPS